MAKREKAAPAKRGKTTTALTKWDAKFAEDAAAAAAVEKLTGGNFVSFKSSQISIGGQIVEGNKLACIVLDSIHTNLYYDTPYEGKKKKSVDTNKPPVCYAFGRSEDDLKPHNDVEHPICDSCADCKNNEWGSSDRGAGKACANVRRLAVIPCGTYNSRTGDFEPMEGPEDYKDAEVHYVKLPVTSVKGYASWVHTLKSTLERPPYAVYALMKLVGDDDTMFKIVFETLGSIDDDDIMQVVYDKAQAAKDQITFPFPKAASEAKARRGAASGKGGRPAARRESAGTGVKGKAATGGRKKY